MNTNRRKLFSYLLGCTLVVGNLVFASAATAGKADYYGSSTENTDAEMLADIFLVRPMALAGTIIGTATFVVTLPFSLLGGNVGETGRALVVAPAKRTFVHPLGDLE